VVRVELGFSGEVADLYHRYRHGYPAAVIGELAGAFGLDDRDVVVDVGCGTGQLTLPMARRVRAVVGVDLSRTCWRGPGRRPGILGCPT
jgi:2-polyprenyl-3-methyl-5-hydroxy-6-metoxy-1,4-benzoquinol methylase